mmetsp:Transcript_12758/g.32629  ORF Transcript_12758/g.32629 Transcript_12758/m.32629 type:complete len:107 (-) Transcript_12758:561-881(-)
MKNEIEPTVGVPVAAQATMLKGAPTSKPVDEADAELEARLEQGDESLKAAYGRVEPAAVAKRVPDAPFVDRKDYDPYQASSGPAWEKIKPQGKNMAGGHGQSCIIA